MTARELTDEGRRLRAAGRRDEAIATLERAVADDARLFDAQFQLGWAYADAARWAEAAEAFRRAHALDPAHADAHNNLGWALAGAGRFDEAQPILEDLVRMHQNHRLGWRNLGWAARARHEWARAVEAYREAARLAPDDLEVRIQGLTVAANAGRWDDALAWLDELLRRWPVEAARFRGLPRVLANVLAGDAAAATAHVDAQAVPPTEIALAAAAYAYDLSSIRGALGRREEALADARRALGFTLSAIAEAEPARAGALLGFRARIALDDVVDEMKRVGLWEVATPTAEQLASMGAFGTASMAFEQWLRWVFVPRVLECLRTGGPWPTGSAVAVQATREWAMWGDEPRFARLTEYLRAFDALFA